MEHLLKEYPATLDLRIQWGDMDAAQHVNNTVYLRWFESARIHYFSQLVDFMQFRGGNGVGPILAEISCRYKIPLTFPDTITVAARILPESIDEYSFLMHNVVVSHLHGRIAAEGTARLVCYDYQQLRKAPIPLDLRNKILEIEARK